MGPPLLKVSYTVRTGPQKRKICEPSLLCRALNPTPCNNAPFIGVQAPGNLSSQQIYKIVVSANTGSTADSVLLGSLQFDVAAPEPAVIFLSGAGLVLISLLRRKPGAAGSKR